MPSVQVDGRGNGEGGVVQGGLLSQTKSNPFYAINSFTIVIFHTDALKFRTRLVLVFKRVWKELSFARVQQPGFINELPLSVCPILATQRQVSWAHYSLFSPQLWSTILHHMFVGLNTKPKFNTFYTPTGLVLMTLQGVPPPLAHSVLARVKKLTEERFSHWNKSFIGNPYSQFVGVDTTRSGRNEWEAGGLLSRKTEVSAHARLQGKWAKEFLDFTFLLACACLPILSNFKLEV